jgi:hypothetical protein
MSPKAFGSIKRESEMAETNTRRVDVFNPLISLIKLPESFLVVGAMSMGTLHLGRKENCLLTSKRKRILG